uniref:Uncharacterized protein n=1 Tax=Cyclopterus lumpus TaxID=8103 RepID=A0A8C2XSY7_CYCLU
KILPPKIKMMRTVLFLLLLKTSACCGFGFKGCSLNFPMTDVIWCFNQNIANLTEVVSMLPDNITTLNLSKNKIRVIPPGAFSQMLGLKRLDLSQNQLVSLKGGEFRGLGVLECLNLTCNNISHIHSHAFDGLTGLQTLLMIHNILATLSLSIFKVNVSCFPALEYIRLSNNSKLELQADVKSVTLTPTGSSL